METTILLAIMIIVLLEVTFVAYKLQKTEKKQSNNAIYVDTSVLIDGRILSVAKAGFITSELVIPKSVLGELQFLADNADHAKRARARHGLDVARQLRQMDSLTTRILQDGAKAREGVDERLLNLVKKHGGSVCTIDYNLNKVAQVEGIAVLNINELAKNLRITYLPGEKTKLELTQKGQDSHQAVGYIEDGTMVVVENAIKMIGKIVEVEFIRAIQTDAGKMLFARLTQSAGDVAKPKPKGRRPQERAQKVVVAKADTVPARTKRAAVDTPEPVETLVSTKKESLKPQHQHRSRPQNRRQTNEDRLIAMVDKQD